jgi:site-specific recombinase XerD
MSTLKHFVIWISEPIEQVSSRTVLAFIDHLLDKRLMAKTINCYLDGIRGFYDYLIHEESVQIVNPVKRGYVLKLSRPLPRYLRDEEIPRLFAVIDHMRDRAIFMLMLRCGLRVEEVAQLTLGALDLPRSQLFVYHGKGAKDRVVYLSRDAQQALLEYLRSRSFMRAKRLFLVDKGRCKGNPLSVTRSASALSSWVAIVWRLCRARHKRHNAEFRIMPSDFRMWGYPWFCSISCSA